MILAGFPVLTAPNLGSSKKTPLRSCHPFVFSTISSYFRISSPWFSHFSLCFSHFDGLLRLRPQAKDALQGPCGTTPCFGPTFRIWSVSTSFWERMRPEKNITYSVLTQRPSVPWLENPPFIDHDYIYITFI